MGADEIIVDEVNATQEDDVKNQFSLVQWATVKAINYYWLTKNGICSSVVIIFKKIIAPNDYLEVKE